VEVLDGCADAGMQHDVRLGLLSQIGIRDRCDRALEDGAVGREGGLDLDRRDVLARPPDYLLRATRVLEKSVCAARGQITRVQPAVAEHLRRGHGVVVVAVHEPEPS
jgi:hypothetical protein